MSDTKHDEHEQPHDSCCGHSHDHGDEQPLETSGDPASQSLASALRVSFKMLKFIMILAMLAFLGTGFSSIDAQEKGVIKLFGRITGTSGQGPAWAWPFPVGEIEKVPVQAFRMSVEDFWFHETPEDKTKELRLKQSYSLGLRPGWDGALLTGDRNLLHVMLSCTYKIVDPVAVKRQIQDTQRVKDAVTGKERYVALEDLVRSVICQAAIKTAAGRTADGIRTDINSFAVAVSGEAQKRLDDLVPANIHGASSDGDQARYQSVKIETVSVDDVAWPLKALPAYEEVDKALRDGQRVRFDAIRKAGETLSGAMGPGYTKLVGEPWLAAPAGPTTLPATPAAMPAADHGEYDLVGQYMRAKEARNEKLAEDLLSRIDTVLVSNATGGKAASVIEEARKYRTSIEQQVKARALRFEEVLPNYLSHPDLTLQRLWADARQELLSSPGVLKMYLTFGNRPTVLQINLDPELRKELERWLAQQKKDKDREQENRAKEEASPPPPPPPPPSGPQG